MMNNLGKPAKDGDKIQVNSIVMNKDAGDYKDKDGHRFGIVTKVVEDEHEDWRWYKLHNVHVDMHGKHLMLLVTNPTAKQLQEVRDGTFLKEKKAS